MNADEIAEKKRLEDETEYLKTEFQKLMDHELSDLTSTQRELISHLSIQEQVDFIKEHKSKGTSQKKEPKRKIWQELTGNKPKPKTPLEQLAEHIKEVQKNKAKAKKEHPHIDTVV